jgi:signal transduction histidine kinase
MASERTSSFANPGRMVAAGALLLAAAAFSAGAWQRPMVVAGSSLAAALALTLLRRGLRTTAAGWEGAPALPLEGPPPLTEGQHQHFALQTMLAESRLEYAPIALFRMPSLEPLNASARRLLAPGRAADRDALAGSLASLAAGQRSVVAFDTEAGRERALACANTLTVSGTPEQLVALMPMEDELSAEAMQAWQKLVAVLTHEIMNSLTPVASLSKTTRGLLAGVQLPDGLAQDLDTALDAISRRADSLAQFVSGYRALATVPEAQSQAFELRSLFDRVRALAAPGWRERGGILLFGTEPESLQLLADPGQIEQALVNLLQNAADATAGVATPQATINATLVRGGRLCIEVADNGPGVPDEVVAQIFTPFFTTKPNGSGIGLALVKQLVHRNRGTVRYTRSVTGGARFVLTF